MKGVDGSESDVLYEPRKMPSGVRASEIVESSRVASHESASSSTIAKQPTVTVTAEELDEINSDLPHLELHDSSQRQKSNLSTNSTNTDTVTVLLSQLSKTIPRRFDLRQFTR